MTELVVDGMEIDVSPKRKRFGTCRATAVE
jgi:hypothetical protein